MKPASGTTQPSSTSIRTLSPIIGKESVMKLIQSLIILPLLALASGACAVDTLVVNVTVNIASTTDIVWNADANPNTARKWLIQDATVDTPYLSSTADAIKLADGTTSCTTGEGLDIKNNTALRVGLTIGVANASGTNWSAVLIAGKAAEDTFVLRATEGGAPAADVVDAAGNAYTTDQACWTKQITTATPATLTSLAGNGIRTLDLEFITPHAVSAAAASVQTITITATTL